MVPAMTRTNYTAIGLALLACLLWSGNFITARGVHEFIPPFTLAFWRWCVALAFIAPFGARYVRRDWPLIRSHWKYLAVMGIFGVGCYNTMIYLAAHHTTAHHIALISSTAPIWTLFLAGLIGTERLTRYKTGGATIAFAGSLMIISQGDPASILTLQWNRGDLILLAAAWVWAGYCVGLHYKPDAMHAMTLLTCIFAIGIVFLLPFYLVEAASKPTPFTANALAAYAYVGIAASVIAWFAWNNAVHAIGSIKAGLVYYTIPLFSGLLAVWLLDEPLALYHFIGFILIFSGIVVSHLRKMRLTTS